jgi:hypothetical protein
MKKIFQEQLFDYLFQIISKRNWQMDWSCEKELNQLIRTSIEQMDYNDCAKEEMRQFAKTNLLILLKVMRLDAKKRGLWYLDDLSVANALSNLKLLWPYKTSDEIFRTSNYYLSNEILSA